MSLVDYADPRNYDTHVHRFFEAQFLGFAESTSWKGELKATENIW